MIVRLLARSLPFRAAAVVSGVSLVMLIVPSEFIQFVGLVTLLMCPAFMSHRATPFEAVIPVDARRIFLTRMSLGLAVTCLPLVAWILAGHLRGVPAEPAAALMMGQGIRVLALPIGALILVLPHALNPGVLPPPDRGPRIQFGWAALAIGCAVAVSLASVALATVVLTVAAVGTLAYTWHRMPQSYQLAPAGMGRAGLTMPAADARAVATGAVQWWRPLLREVLPRRALIVAILIGVFASVGDLWLLYLFILSGSEMAGMARQRLQWMHTLPLSRTVLLWANLAPAALSLLAVLMVGAVVGPALFPGFDALHQGRPRESSRDEVFERRTMVPLAFWRIAPSGDAPVVRAPWGETTTTDMISLPGLTLHNPYSTRTGSSPELVEWQFGRASAAVHGRSFTTEEYHAEDFVAPRRVTRSVPVYLLGGAMTLTLVLMIAWLTEVGRWHVLTARPVLRHTIDVFTGILFLSMGLELYGMFVHGTALLVPLGAALAMQAAAVLPNIGIVAVVAALPVVAAYSLLHWQIARSDITGE